MTQQILNPRKLAVSRTVSRLLRLFYFKKKNGPLPEKKTIRKILVMEYECIGDLIMLTSVLRTLKDYYQTAELHLVVCPAVKDLAIDANLADHIHVMPKNKRRKFLKGLRTEKFDISFNFHGDMRQLRVMKKVNAVYRAGFSFSGGEFWLTHYCDYPYKIHQAERPFVLLEKMGIKSDNHIPELPVFQKDIRYEKSIVLHGGANHPERRWPLSSWQKVIDGLKDEYDLVWISVPGETDIPENISVLSCSLTDLSHIFASCKLLICCDSMAGHLAAAVGTPTLALFGSQDPELTRPYGEKSHVITPGRPCTHKRKDWRLCGECMRDISSEEVFIKVKDLMRH